MLRRVLPEVVFRSFVVASLTCIGCGPEESVGAPPPPPPPILREAPRQHLPLPNPVLADPFLDIRSAGDTPDIDFIIDDPGACRPGDALRGRRITRGGVAIYAAREPDGVRETFTLVNDLGSCVVETRRRMRLAFRYHEDDQQYFHTCPTVRTVRGCGLTLGEALAIRGEHRATLTLALDMPRTELDSLEEVGLANPWRSPLRYHRISQYELENGYTLIESDAHGRFDDDESYSVHVIIVMHEGRPVWYDHIPQVVPFHGGGLHGLLTVDDEPLVLFTTGDGIWILRAVRDGRSWIGYWP